jgi:hypothetical protein
MARPDDRRRLAFDEESERVPVAAQDGVDDGPGLRVVHEGRLASDLRDWFDRSFPVQVWLIRGHAPAA